MFLKTLEVAISFTNLRLQIPGEERKLRAYANQILCKTLRYLTFC